MEKSKSQKLELVDTKSRNGQSCFKNWSKLVFYYFVYHYLLKSRKYTFLTFLELVKKHKFLLYLNTSQYFFAAAVIVTKTDKPIQEKFILKEFNEPLVLIM